MRGMTQESSLVEMMNDMNYSLARIHQNELLAEAAAQRLANELRTRRDGSIGLGFHFAIPLTGAFARHGRRSANTT